MTSRAHALLLCTLAALVPTIGQAARARADVAVVVPPIQDVSSELVEPAVEELTRLLKVHGFDVISAGQAGSAAEAEQERGGFPREHDPFSCITAQCADEYRKVFDATFAVQLTLTTRGARASAVSVVLTEGPGTFFTSSAPVEGRDIRGATRIAFASARKKQEEGAGPWLSVAGTPEGALVYVDEAEYGRVPFARRHIEPGSHRLQIRADAHAPEQRALEIPSDIDHVEQVEVALKPLVKAVAAAPRASSRLHRRRTVWDWALGGALAAAGAAHLAAGIYQKTIAGDCSDVEASTGRCVERYGDAHGPKRENMLIGFGAAGVALSAAVIVFGPVGWLQLRTQRDSAQLQLKGAF